MTRSIAFLVAVDQFADPSFGRLQFPQNDVSGMERVFSNPDISDFEPTVLRNPKRDSIITELENIASALTPEDKIIYYYAGHWKRSRRAGDLYLVASDTRADALLGTGIPIDMILKIMRESSCRQRVLILDCCYSGAVSAVFRGGE